MTRHTTMTLDELAGEIEREMIEYADALRPGDERELVIVDETHSIVDGFHRVAGMVRWAREQGRDLNSVAVRVVECDDVELVAVAAEPGNAQRAALDAIYALLG